jgi:hypothetical protein
MANPEAARAEAKADCCLLGDLDRTLGGLLFERLLCQGLLDLELLAERIEAESESMGRGTRRLEPREEPFATDENGIGGGEALVGDSTIADGSSAVGAPIEEEESLEG